MPQILLQFVLPLAFQAIQSYIKNSSSKNDDQVLDLAKLSCQYLAGKDNNTVTYGHVASLGSTQYFGEVIK